jgi:hypothetical protein
MLYHVRVKLVGRFLLYDIATSCYAVAPKVDIGSYP